MTSFMHTTCCYTVHSLSRWAREWETLESRGSRGINGNRNVAGNGNGMGIYVMGLGLAFSQWQSHFPTLFPISQFLCTDVQIRWRQILRTEKCNIKLKQFFSLWSEMWFDRTTNVTHTLNSSRDEWQCSYSSRHWETFIDDNQNKTSTVLGHALMLSESQSWKTGLLPANFMARKDQENQEPVIWLAWRNDLILQPTRTSSFRQD